jgi:hypothetical protein
MAIAAVVLWASPVNFGRSVYSGRVKYAGELAFHSPLSKRESNCSASAPQQFLLRTMRIT